MTESIEAVAAPVALPLSWFVRACRSSGVASRSSALALCFATASVAVATDPPRANASGTSRPNAIAGGTTRPNAVVGDTIGAPSPVGPGKPRLANWFDDPFFQVRDAVPDCPTPLGPLTTGDELQTQTHARSERGTRCWLEGRCTRPNSYLYDQDIADGVRRRFANTKAYRDASLWVTVQRRIVWIEGCVARTYRNGTLDRLAASVPDVELVVVNVRRGSRDKVPYRRLETESSPAR